MLNPHAEANIHWTVFRELFEELFKGEEAERDSTRLAHNWYFDASEPLRWFKDHDAFTIEIVSAGFNALTGGFEYALLLVVDDSWYYNHHVAAMEPNWEARRIEWISSTNTKAIHDLTIQPDWTSEGFFSFIQGMRHLQRRFPVRTALPPFQPALAPV